MNESTIDIPKLSPMEKVVYDAFQQHGAMTDQQLEDVTGVSVRTVSPRRRKLADHGLVEEVGKATTRSGRKAALWDVVPADRIEEAREKGARREPRKKPIKDLPLATKLEVVRQLLDDPHVNEAVHKQNGRAWRKVRGRARDRRGQREHERRELNAELRKAEEEKSALVHFFKLKRNLMEATEHVRGTGEFIDNDLRRRDALEGMLIPIGLWPEVADLLIDLSTIAETTLRSIHDAMGVLGDDVIEGTAIEVEDIFELPEGVSS